MASVKLRAMKMTRLTIGREITFLLGRFGSAILNVLQKGLIRNSMAIKELGILGDISQSPIPEGADNQILRDTGFGVSYSLCDDNLPGNPLAQGKDTGKIRMKKHSITEIPELLIYIKSLGGHIDQNVIMTLELEKVPDLRLEQLIVPIIPNHTYLVQQEQRMGLRDIISQMLYIKMADTGNKKFLHIRIDQPALFHILLGQLDKICRFSGAFLSKNKIKLIRIKIFSSSKVKAQRESNQQNEEDITHNFTSF